MSSAWDSVQGLRTWARLFRALRRSIMECLNAQPRAPAHACLCSCGRGGGMTGEKGVVAARLKPCPDANVVCRPYGAPACVLRNPALTRWANFFRASGARLDDELIG